MGKKCSERVARNDEKIRVDVKKSVCERIIFSSEKRSSKI